MMFLIRTAFWLSVVIMLIPVDQDAARQSRAGNEQPIGALEAASAAQEALNDVSGFCGRNPAACSIGERVGTTFMLKARTGARIVSDFIDKQLGDASGTASVNHGTLNSSDLATEWHGPAKAPQDI
ncbi:DUF5330 domain-containing protein [Oryzibacter oryziterrae]|uniref:DUF5330 domain-containing protein n=1 Tax=Oryzibacter oryziterrae TaxID=2766474 RepID=UPI001F366A29|nr:DUF5330 domain-containing protein [Oryzibacter oryziterrae]